MTSKFLRILLAVAVTLTFSALAQTGSAATPSIPAATPASPLPSAPGAPSAPSTGTKVGTINIQEAIFGSNEGQRDMQALQKKFEPKQTELKSQNDELEAMKKQLSTQQDKLNEEALGNLKKQIEGKQKSFDRAVQDAQEEVGSQQQDIASRILQKMAPMIVKYSQDNGFGLIVDTSKPWPQSNVLWWGEAIDITKPVVEAYNVQSGVPAPAAPSATKPAAPKAPASTTPKPAAPKSSEPPKQ
jgi:outer membrane protein